MLFPIDFRYTVSHQALYAAAGGFNDAILDSLQSEDDGLLINGLTNITLVRTTGSESASTPTDLLTYTSPSLKWVLGADGTLKYANHNLLIRSQEFDSATWNKTFGSTTVTANTTVAPDGTTTADTWNENTGAGSRVVYHSVGGTIAASQEIQFSIYLKYVDLQYVKFEISAGGGVNTVIQNVDLSAMTLGASSGSGTYVASSITSVGDGWYRYVLRGICGTSTTILPHIYMMDAAGTSDNYTGTGRTFIAWGAELKSYPVHDDGTLAGYLPTTSAARYAIPIDHDASNNPLGLLIEDARTNLCLQSDDFTNASWTKSNMTTAKTATGPDGVSNSASTLTATAGNATALQAITSGSAERITSCYIKRRTGSGNIDMTQDNGSTWATVTVTSSWTRVNIAAATLANPTVGIRIVTSGDAVDVGLFQHEVGAFITSPIVTTTATVTRAADQISLATSSFPWSATNGMLVVKARPKATGVFRAVTTMTAGTGADTTIKFQIDQFNDSYFVVDDTTGQASIFTGSTAANTPYAVAAAYKANDFAASKDGGSVSTDTSGSVPTVNTMLIGKNHFGSYFNGHIQWIKYVPRDVSDANLVSDSAL